MNGVILRFEAPVLASGKGDGVCDFMGILACCSHDNLGTYVCCNA